MSDLIVRAEALKKEINDCEQQAREHEDAARNLRARRQEAKVELSELSIAINQAVQQQSAANAAGAAAKAQAAAEAHKTEAAATLERLKAKEKQLDELLAKAATGGEVPAP